MWKCKKCGGTILPYGITPLVLDEETNIVSYDFVGVYCKDHGGEYETFSEIAEWEEE